MWGFKSKYKEHEERIVNLEAKVFQNEEFQKSVTDTHTVQAQKIAKIVQFVKTKDTEYKEANTKIKNEV